MQTRFKKLLNFLGVKSNNFLKFQIFYNLRYSGKMRVNDLKYGEILNDV